MKIQNRHRAIIFVLVTFILLIIVQKRNFFKPQIDEIQKEAYWNKLVNQNGSINERVIGPTSEVLRNLSKINSENGLPLPSGIGIDEKDLNLVRKALNNFPDEIKKEILKDVAGITVVSGLGSLGYSNLIAGKDGTAVKGFIVIDKRILSVSSNELFSWRESTPFHCDNGWKVMVDAGSESWKGQFATQYILLHEFAHVFSGNTTINPTYGSEADEKTLQSTDFGKISWNVLDHKFISKFEEKFKERPLIKYYIETSKTSCERALNYYEDLKKTDFPVLYATQDPFEDFAESFANYIQVKVFRRKFEVTIIKDEKVLLNFQPCWGEARCSVKENYMVKVYNYFKRI